MATTANIIPGVLESRREISKLRSIPKGVESRRERRKVTRSAKDILADVRALAVEYYQLTGKPLGVTGEIGEFEAAEKMELELGTARTDGYDAIRPNGPYRLGPVLLRAPCNIG